MTDEQTEQNAAAVSAFLRGQPVEFNIGNLGVWRDSENPSWNFDNGSYRPKPVPKTRPWSKPEDVPGPVCWIRANAKYYGALVVGLTDDGPVTAGIEFNILQYWSVLRDGAQYSTDRVTWKKCEVTE